MNIYSPLSLNFDSLSYLNSYVFVVSFYPAGLSAKMLIQMQAFFTWSTEPDVGFLIMFINSFINFLRLNFDVSDVFLEILIF